ncbi:MAG: hypothetical protein J07HX64_01506 [halophilic archaeon J07HX64]|nr:MAG: hypothetical protein J07HX64_01506 [halophilic archaeon J07HX64]
MFADSSVGEHAVRTADTGSEVFEALDTTVDDVLLDRRLPDISGSYTLVEMQQWLDPMVATISAVEPTGRLPRWTSRRIRTTVSCSVPRELVAEPLDRQQLDVTARTPAHWAQNSGRPRAGDRVAGVQFPVSGHTRRPDRARDAALE